MCPTVAHRCPISAFSNGSVRVRTLSKNFSRCSSVESRPGTWISCGSGFFTAAVAFGRSVAGSRSCSSAYFSRVAFGQALVEYV